MSDPVRLSELIGIHQKPTNRAILPLTILIVALGAGVMWLAFANLQQDDPRPLYNPWSYAIATPVILGLLSLLGAMASRVIERTMQVAFLLSVLFHLLFMVYATKIVILSKMWPDVFDALAQERQVLQRFEKQVARYHTLNTAKTGKRPDYLRFVPTTHQPSETKESTEAALQMIAAKRTELASPRPEIEKSVQPHLVPRDKAQLAPPRASDMAAKLSRSQLSAPKPDSSQAERMDFSFDSSSPEPLKATESKESRRAAADISLKNDFEKNLDVAKKPTEAKLDRKQTNDQPQVSDPTRPVEKSLTSAAPKRGSIDVPNAPMIENAPSKLTDSASELARARNNPTTLAAPSNVEKLSPSMPRSNPINRRAETNADLRLPKPKAGDRPNAFARDSAGGRAAPGAPIAMPAEGLASLATPEKGPPELSDSLSSLPSRNTKAQRSTSHLPDLGTAQSPMASPDSSFSNGTAGRANSTMPQRSLQGQAMLEDVADMTGSGRTMQRSTVGIASQTGAIAVPGGVIVDGRDDGNPSQLAASAPGDQRSKANIQTYGQPQAVPNQTPQLMRGVPDGIARNTSNIPVNEGSSSNATSSLPKQSNVQAGMQGMAAIAVPEEANDLNEPSSPGDIVANGSIAAMSRLSETASSISGRLDLPLDASPGPGGLADFSKLDGSVLPRPSRNVETALSEIEAQRFAKKDLGGPLAAGNSIPLPKPAFKQRLDRLKDRSGMEDVFMGPQTELAIEMGLEFLAKRQSSSGAWRLQDFDTKVLIRSDTAATGLALLSFQGAGYTHQQYQYADNVGKALQFLLKNQRPNGDLYKPEDPASDQNGWLYSHAIAALALCEAYGMTQDPELRGPAQRAIDFMVASQDPNRGGWRYRPGNGTDTSVSGWFMMAFKSGQLAGLNVPAATFDRIEKYLDQSQVSKQKSHLYRYNPFAPDTPEQRHGREPTPVMTSAGLLMRLYFGWRRDQKEMMSGADYLLENPPAPGTPDATLRDTYYWYYSTQVLFHMGGERWKKWNAKLYPMLIETQVTEGPMAGSWDPYRPTADLWARYGGRLYVTTLNLLSLEVNYRHLPLYDSTAK